MLYSLTWPLSAESQHCPNTAASAEWTLCICTPRSLSSLVASSLDNLPSPSTRQFDDDSLRVALSVALCV